MYLNVWQTLKGCFLLAFLLSTTVVTWASSSTIEGEPTSISEKQARVLSDHFKQYDLYSIPTEELAAEMATLAVGEQTDIQVRLGEQALDIRLEPAVLRDDAYLLNAPTLNVSSVERSTFKGYVLNNGGAYARLSIREGVIKGALRLGNSDLYIEPLHEILQAVGAPLTGLEKDQFIVYDAADVIVSDAPFCGVNKAQHLLEHMTTEPADPKAEGPESQSRLEGVCGNLQYAIAADFTMLEAYDSAAELEMEILDMLNLVVEWYYQEPMNLNFQLMELYICQPHEILPDSITDSGVVLNTFGDWGNAGGFTNDFDDATFMSKRTMQDGVLGLAWLSAVCSNNRYNIIQHTGSLNFRTRIQAHELGHNLSLEHNNLSSYIMFPSANFGSNLWSPLEMDLVTEYRNNSNCMAAVCQIPDASIFANLNSICPGESVLFFDFTENADISYWTFNGGNILNYEGVTPPLIYFDEPGDYEVVLYNENELGGDSDTIMINVQAQPDISIVADGDTDLCGDESVNLSVAGPDEFTWSSIHRSQVGGGDLSTNIPFQTTYTNGKAYFIYKQDELLAGGLQAGQEIDAMSFHINEAGVGINDVMIRMAATELESLAEETVAPDFGTTALMARQSMNFEETGWYRIPFNGVYTWDGSSNLLLEMSFENTQTGADNYLSASATDWVSGIYKSGEDQYLDLDGTNDYLRTPAGIHFTGGDLTIETWLYPRAHANWSRIIDFGDGSDADNVILTVSRGDSGKIRLSIRRDNDAQEITAQVIPPLDEWTHVAATLEDGFARIYFNGEEVQSGNVHHPKPVWRDNCYIGESNWGGDAYANARFDEFRIWHKALPQSVIQEWMNRTLDETHYAWDDLHLYHSFNNQATGDSLILDESPNALHANAFGAPILGTQDGHSMNRLFTTTHLRPNVQFDQIQALDTTDPNINVSGTGAIYIASTTDPDGCSTTSDIVEVTHCDDPLLQIGQDEVDNYSSVYPNPNNGFFTFYHEPPLSSGAQFKLFDVQGRLLQNTRITESTAPAHQHFIQLVDHAPGIYFLWLKTAEGLAQTHKVVVR